MAQTVEPDSPFLASLAIANDAMPSHAPRRREVLIVDDVPNNLRVLSIALKEHGYQVRTVLSAKMAFSAIQMSAPDLILLDINLPDLDGYSICRELKLHPETSEIPIIFLSALGEAENKVAAFQNGGVDYITKPFQLEEVIARVSLQFKLKELSEDLRNKNVQLNQLAEHLKKQNEELSQARLAADQANQAKSEFLSRMSHELRTPLTAILGFNQLLMGDQEIKPRQRETMGIIDRSGRHLLNLINEVLDLAKIEANRAELHPSLFSLEDCLHGIHQMFLLEAKAKGLEFSLDCGDNVPPFIRADERKLQQIIINLLGNALKFTVEGFVRLSVQAHQLSDSSSNIQLIIQVKDSGAGIAETESPFLFEAFRQTQTGQQSRQGTGLGLCVSRQFAQLMGGDIQLESQINVGTTFTVTLQCEAVQSAAMHEAEKPTDKTFYSSARAEPLDLPDISELITAAPSHQGGKGLSTPLLRPSAAVVSACNQIKMLVVDDNPENRMLLARLLESAGCQVKQAGTGAEAIALYSQWLPQLIWMDMRLPDMDGLTAIEQIKQDAADTADHPHIVATTASVYDKDQLAAAASRCDGLIQKPFSVHQIWQKVFDLLGGKDAEQPENPTSAVDGVDQPRAQTSPTELDTSSFSIPLSAQNMLSSWSTQQQTRFMLQLEAMPQPWLHQLYHSSIALDESASDNLLQAIPEDATELKLRLGALFQNLRYDLVLTSLEKINPEHYSLS